MSRFGSISDKRFASWAAKFAAHARSKGLADSTIGAVLGQTRPNPAVVAADRNQPETVIPIGEYLQRVMPPDRVERGISHRDRLSEELAGIEDRYRVERQIILAIWGAESDFGRRIGDYRVIQALATLACDGRRRAFAEGELISALNILEHGDVSEDQLIGSWAGAMGHTQFMPSSFLAYAVDHDGDGRRDIWNPANPLDALASTANYLAEHGWQQGTPWAVEVSLPNGFDYLQADPAVSAPLGTWQDRGVVASDGTDLLTGDHHAALFLPAGASGPAFLIFGNFRVLQKYNASERYALAVALFADCLVDAPPVQVDWPSDSDPLSRKDVAVLQERLQDHGFDPGAADGLVGPDTRAAVRKFQLSEGLIPDGYVSAGILERLR